MTKVVNIKNYDGDYIYIGRGSVWGNPFTVARYGRKRCLELYEKYFRNSPVLMADVIKLDGEVLGCYCKPKPCHGDIIIKIIEEIKKGKENEFRIG